jgi:hypothetical protein
MPGTFVPRDGKLLIVINAPMATAARMCRAMGRPSAGPPGLPRSGASMPCSRRIPRSPCRRRPLRDGVGDPQPRWQIAAVVAQRGRRLLVDSKAARRPAGRCPRIAFDALASANKCLEGVPASPSSSRRGGGSGVAPAMRRPSASISSIGSGDGETAQWRFTRRRVIAALGAPSTRGRRRRRQTGARYRANCNLVDGMQTRLPRPCCRRAAGLILITFHAAIHFHFRDIL